MIERLCSRHVVLLGIGHTNAYVLRRWRMNPVPDTDLTCISDHLLASYSGMLPAVLAGQIPRRQMEIDLVQLCASAGARLLTDRVAGIDHSARLVMFDDRPPVPFDVLSIGIGSKADRGDVEVDSDSFVEIKPMQSFLDRLTAALQRAIVRAHDRELRVLVVGGGVAGVEISACLPGFLNKLTSRSFSISLITRSDRILPTDKSTTRRLIEQEFQQRGVALLTDVGVTRVTGSTVELTCGAAVDADLVIWATSASAPPLLSHLGLDLDARGFIATEDTLQSISASHVFAVGDTGTIVDQKIPKAGVYAVRQSPVLWENIQRSLTGATLRRYRPQKSFLKLINLGDGRAVGQWNGFSFSGHWAMRLKDWIDSRFISKFQVEPMNAEQDTEAMQCRGCGCKLGTEALQVGLSGMDLGGIEDAAVIAGTGSRYVASTDFFSSPVIDPYLSGRIAAIHSASDIIASGAAPIEALANVVLPAGEADSQQRVLSEFMAGAKREFDSMRAAIVGGHTVVGPRMEVGFTVIGKALGESWMRKGNLKPGDRLYLTKPLGIGVLLAAHMRSQCVAQWYQQLIATMLEPQQIYAQVAADLGIRGGTDVTGFGLAGHLIEILTASEVRAEIWLNQVPILPGVVELIEQGIESSLAPANRQADSRIETTGPIRRSAKYQILFDPQTCGGLLFGVSEDRVDRFQQAIASDFVKEIGLVGRVDLDRRPLTVTDVEKGG